MPLIDAPDPMVDLLASAPSGIRGSMQLFRKLRDRKDMNRVLIGSLVACCAFLAAFRASAEDAGDINPAADEAKMIKLLIDLTPPSEVASINAAVDRSLSESVSWDENVLDAEFVKHRTSSIPYTTADGKIDFVINKYVAEQFEATVKQTGCVWLGILSRLDGTALTLEEVTELLLVAKSANLGFEKAAMEKFSLLEPVIKEENEAKLLRLASQEEAENWITALRILPTEKKVYIWTLKKTRGPSPLLIGYSWRLNGRWFSRYSRLLKNAK